MVSPLPSPLPCTSPSSSAKAGPAKTTSDVAATDRVVSRREAWRRVGVLTSGKLSDALPQHGGKPAHPRVGEQVLERHLASVAVTDREPPVRILVDGARHVGLAKVAYGVTRGGHDVTARRTGEEPVQGTHPLLLRCPPRRGGAAAPPRVRPPPRGRRRRRGGTAAPHAPCATTSRPQPRRLRCRVRRARQ